MKVIQILGVVSLLENTADPRYSKVIRIYQASAATVYEVQAPVAAFLREYELQGIPFGGVSFAGSLWVHIRETWSATNGPASYAFPSAECADVFDRLITVDSVGPGRALPILASTPAALILDMIRRNDREAFCKLPGVGSKTGLKIVQTIFPNTALIAAEGEAAARTDGDAILALIALGYKKDESTKAVERVMSEHKITDTPAIIRASLKLLV